ncbi:dihydrofolate reductase family protein [Brevibacterium sp. UMB10442]|nr:dihydrofolate reductase family protein [Brevibacterium sp. UMB10442]
MSSAKPNTELWTALPQHRALPATSGEPDLVELYDSYMPVGGVRVQSNMVISVDGAVAGADGLSRSVSTPADMRVFSAVRSLADAVVVGAQTVRSERLTRMSPKPTHADQRRTRGQADVPTMVIVTSSGDLPWDRINARGTSPVWVATNTSDPQVLAQLRRHADEVLTGVVSPQAVKDALVARGLRRIVCEGGPSVLAQWMDAGLIDEMCLTVSPQLLGAPGAPRLFGEGIATARDVEVLSLVTDGQSMMYRLKVCGVL